MKRKALWISIIGILLIGFVCLFCYRHYIRQKQIEQKKHTGLVSEDFPIQDIKHQIHMEQIPVPFIITEYRNKIVMSSVK